MKLQEEVVVGIVNGIVCGIVHRNPLDFYEDCKLSQTGSKGL
jgi:hypothetical protein